MWSYNVISGRMHRRRTTPSRCAFSDVYWAISFFKYNFRANLNKKEWISSMSPGRHSKKRNLIDQFMSLSGCISVKTPIKLSLLICKTWADHSLTTHVKFSANTQTSDAPCWKHWDPTIKRKVHRDVKPRSVTYEFGVFSPCRNELFYLDNNHSNFPLATTIWPNPLFACALPLGCLLWRQLSNNLRPRHQCPCWNTGVRKW